MYKSIKVCCSIPWI